MSKKPKYYQQPDFMGGKKVLSKDVPDNFYTIYFPENVPNEPSDCEVMEHENSLCRTKKDLDSDFNTYSTKTKANQALVRVRKALRPQK